MKKLPLLELVKDETFFSSPEKICILGVQHILPTTVSLIRALVDKGINPENIAILGKCYSTNFEAYQQLKKLGVDVCEGSFFFDHSQPYDNLFEALIDSFLKSRKHLFRNENFGKIIVLDDGGHLLERVACCEELDTSKIVGIEQTSSGYHRLKEIDLAFPVINLARARIKLEAEPAVIVENAVTKICSHFDSNRGQKKALVIGNGFIGSKVKELLLNQFDSVAYDLDHTKSELSTEKMLERLSEFDLIVGCTGAHALEVKHYNKLKKGAVLASVSSSDREFDSAYLRSRSKTLIKSPFIHVNSLGITLLNCGFPANFNGDDTSDDPNFFQLIRALIFASIFQANAIDNLSKGLIPLCGVMQERIYEQFKKMSGQYDVLAVSGS